MGPAKPSDVIVRPYNFFTETPATAPETEVGFFNLLPPAGQVLMMTGFYWSAGGQPGDLIEIVMHVTDGAGDSRFVAPLSTVIGSGGYFAGTEPFPVPVPLFRGTFSHLYLRKQSEAGILGTSGFWLFGFFTPDV